MTEMEQQNDPGISRIEEKLSDNLEQGRDWAFEHEIYDILRIMGCLTPATSFAPSRAELADLDTTCYPGERVVCKLISERMALDVFLRYSKRS
jgi:hypothetical protein